jgi:hypothetical protein
LLFDAVHSGRQLVKALVGLLCRSCGGLSRRIGLLRSLVDRVHSAFESADAVIHSRDMLVHIGFRGTRAKAESADDYKAGCRDAPALERHCFLLSLAPCHPLAMPPGTIRTPNVTAEFFQLSAAF